MGKTAVQLLNAEHLARGDTLIHGTGVHDDLKQGAFGRKWLAAVPLVHDAVRLRPAVVTSRRCLITYSSTRPSEAQPLLRRRQLKRRAAPVDEEKRSLSQVQEVWTVTRKTRPIGSPKTFFERRPSRYRSSRRVQCGSKNDYIQGGSKDPLSRRNRRVQTIYNSTSRRVCTARTPTRTSTCRWVATMTSSTAFLLDTS